MATLGDVEKYRFNLSSVCKTDASFSSSSNCTRIAEIFEEPGVASRFWQKRKTQNAHTNTEKLGEAYRPRDYGLFACSSSGWVPRLRMSALSIGVLRARDIPIKQMFSGQQTHADTRASLHCVHVGTFHQPLGKLASLFSSTVIGAKVEQRTFD